jgi:hypothetical protein
MSRRQAMLSQHKAAELRCQLCSCRILYSLWHPRCGSHAQSTHNLSASVKGHLLRPIRDRSCDEGACY